MASASHLTDLLRAFADTTAPSFSGFPTSRDASRDAWAGAFDDYFSSADLSVAAGTSTMDRSLVKQAFHDALQLTPGIVAATAAADLAGAWAAGVGAVAPAAGTAPYVWSSFTNAPAQQSALEQALVPLFTVPGFAAAADLGGIADAIHSATIGLLEIAVQTSSGTPTSPSPLQ